MSGSRQRGFTRVELVVVIVILAILAGFAIPRYMELNNQARLDALKDMTVSIRSAANMAHGLWLANGNAGQITVDGANINIVNGYPDASGIATLIEDKTGFAVAVAGSTIKFTPEGARTGATCNVVYHQAPNADSPFTLTVQTPPTLESGC
jgi:MSHA pilin protein MshA